MENIMDNLFIYKIVKQYNKSQYNGQLFNLAKACCFYHLICRKIYAFGFKPLHNFVKKKKKKKKKERKLKKITFYFIIYF